MALTESTMIELGNAAPDFALPGTDDQHYSLASFDQPVLVVLFICNHCPYVIHIAPALAQLAVKYRQQGVDFVAINSNDADTYPADSFANMKREHAERAYTFPYLYDETQAVAKAYGAACTPDIYVFNKNRKLVYRGQFDNTRPHRISSGNYDDRDGAASGESLAQAIDLTLAETAITTTQYPSIGCNIKWKPGNAPSYFG